MKPKSIVSNPNNLSQREYAIVAFAVLGMTLIYLIASKLKYAIGFPLDDSWIHQTYARNLAQYGEWSFRPGIKSAGSTSPLWSALLAIGFLLRLSPYIWTYFLGALTLFLLALVCEWGARKLSASYQPKIPWVALLIVFEWHLSWAALSGMETLLHGLIVTTVLILLMTNSPRYLTLGLLTGLAAWVRPDGLTLLAPALMAILFSEKDTPTRLRAISRYLIGFGSLFIPYLLFNLYIGGTPMPNTFYAKQAEYAAWQTKPILERIGQLLLQLLAGPGVALLPGVIGWIISSVKKQAWGSLAAILWCFGYLTLYLLRLPVYQHGRYIMPAMPIFFLFGALALIEFNQSRLFQRYHWVAQAVWQTSLGMICAAFVFVGARAYAADVALIESEMVLTAKWVSQNLPPDALLAVHDIGALGYFDDHQLLDLAGLVSPEVIPFIKNEPRLAQYLNQVGANYLIAFPDFYPLLTKDLEPVFVSNSPITISLGEENMTVYVWKTSE
ncbi:MAG: hypothetical protein IT310_06915 [Anaerolineales bacterium]|nr:hypothetical protein [Anaerolineales bacterium]